MIFQRRSSPAPYCSRYPAISNDYGSLLGWWSSRRSRRRVYLVVCRDQIVGDIERRLEIRGIRSIHHDVVTLLLRQLLEDVRHLTRALLQNVIAIPIHVGLQIVAQTLHVALLSGSLGVQIG